MKLITLSLYIKTIRKYSKNHRQSFQKILGKLFGLIYEDGDYFVESTTSSRIINREYDVPYFIREKYIKKSTEDKMVISDKFINYMVDLSSMDMLMNEIQMIFSEATVSALTKKEIASEDDYHKIFSAFLSLAIISDNRKILNKILYKDNNGSVTLIGGDIIALDNYVVGVKR